MKATEPTTTVHVEMPDASVSPVQVWQGSGRTQPLVMVWPGFGMGGYYFRPLAAELAERGFPVAIGELRGQGRAPPGPPGPAPGVITTWRRRISPARSAR